MPTLLLLTKAGVALEEIILPLYTVLTPIEGKQCAQLHMLLPTPNVAQTMCQAPWY